MSRVDFTEFVPIIRSSVSTQQIGRDYGLNPGRDGRCRCVFCAGDRKDTLRLYPGDRGSYCFRCHTSADCIRLVMEITGMKFPDAVREINEQYGLGLPLDKVDPERTRKAREDAARREQERIEKAERDKRLLTELWDASDEVWNMEQVIKNYAPQSANDEVSDAFVYAVKHIDEVRDYRDRLFDAVYKM